MRLVVAWDARGGDYTIRAGRTGRIGSTKSHSASCSRTAAANRRRYCAHTEAVDAVIMWFCYEALTEHRAPFLSS
jgi:hypothetical protein